MIRTSVQSPRRRRVDDIGEESLYAAHPRESIFGPDFKNPVAEGHLNRTAQVGSPETDLTALKLGDDARMGVAENVVPSAGKDRDPRLYGIEQEVRSGCAAAMMRDF